MTEVVLILLLLGLNGLFAMAEIALVSARKGRLQQRAEDGSTGAALALKLGENPERFLSTVQIGITLVGVLSGAYGGATLSGYVEPWLARIPWLAGHADEVAFGLVVAVITYLSLIIGELVPKSLALRNAEGIASVMAAPMLWLSRIASPLVWVLEVSTQAVMRFLGSPEVQSGPTRSEVKVLLREGLVTGSLRHEEGELVEGVFDLRELHAEEIMRPKPKVAFLHVEQGVVEVTAQVKDTRQTVFPVFDATRDHVVGLVALRDLYLCAAGGQDRKVSELMVEPVFVSENQPALTLLAELRRAPLTAAVVTDEFGIVRGLVTIEDLVEEVIGDFAPVNAHGEPQIRQTAPDKWMVDGMMEIDAVAEAIPGLAGLVDAEEESFQTLAGLIMHHLERLPREGETFLLGAFEFGIVDMDRQRIDKVEIRRAEGPVPAEQAGR